jgi:hypothetical protein
MPNQKLMFAPAAASVPPFMASVLQGHSSYVREPEVT